MTIDDIGYGTPTLRQTKETKQESFLDANFPHLTSFTFPKNSSDATKQELNQIMKSVTALKKDEEKQEEYLLYDKFIGNIYADFLIQHKVKKEAANELVKGLLTETTPFIYKLKYHFQRPRPFQLALYYKIMLMPFLESSSPSFPSKHAFQSKVISEVIGNTYPESYQEVIALHEDICASRISVGVSFQSDIDVGIFAGELCCGMNEFKLKYKL